MGHLSAPSSVFQVRLVFALLVPCGVPFAVPAFGPLFSFLPGRVPCVLLGRPRNLTFLRFRSLLVSFLAEFSLRSWAGFLGSSSSPAFSSGPVFPSGSVLGVLSVLFCLFSLFARFAVLAAWVALFAGFCPSFQPAVSSQSVAFFFRLFFCFSASWRQSLSPSSLVVPVAQPCASL